MTITNNELWNMPNEEISKLTKGKTLLVNLYDGKRLRVRIEKISVAANLPHLFCEFITTDGYCIPLEEIDYIEV